MTVQSQRYFEIHDETGAAERTSVIFFHEIGSADFASGLRESIHRLLSEGYATIQLDLRKINMCDSLTLGMFVGLNATAKNRNMTLEFILHRDSHVRKMFTALGLQKVLSFQEVQTTSPPKWRDSPAN